MPQPVMLKKVKLNGSMKSYKTFYLFFFNFYFYFILLYNTELVLPYIDMNPPRVYMSSQTWTPLPLPTPYHLSGMQTSTATMEKSVEIP